MDIFRIPDDVLSIIFSYLPFVEIEEYLIILNINKLSKNKIIKRIHDQKLTVIKLSTRDIYYVEGVKCRIDGPAIIWHNGATMWYKNGKIHREDGPAFLHPSGIKKWYKNDNLVKEETITNKFYPVPF
jgi:hypothetical protein